MTNVEAVKGPVRAEDLHTVLMHEHVFVRSEELQRNLPDTWNEDLELAAAEAKPSALASRGVRTLVDATVIGLGRDVARVARVNAETPDAGQRRVPFVGAALRERLDALEEGRETAYATDAARS
jgi:predicted metal-dependent phosphotriesterase family hydrolase